MTCGAIFRWLSSRQIFSYLCAVLMRILLLVQLIWNVLIFLVLRLLVERVWVRWDVWWAFSRYLVVKFVISALTVGICRSVCRTVFGTYRGALGIDLRTLFWNLCSISMLELLGVPQREMPYVQMGFRIVLYISNLFFQWQLRLSSHDPVHVAEFAILSCFLSINMC